MGILDSIVAGGVGTALGAFGSFAKDIREAITGKAILDPNKQAELLLRAQEMEQAQVLALMAYDKAQMEAQLAINKAEAESGSSYKGGWRPFVGWACGVGFALQIIVFPIGVFYLRTFTSRTAAAPTLDAELLYAVLFGMLGIGGMRSYEKVKGVSK